HINRVAFGGEAEAMLVDRLRTSPAFIPDLSLVAVERAASEGEPDASIVGHILLTRAAVVGESREDEALALAPMAVLPEMQGRGIGSMLVRRALADAAALGHELVIVLGHPGYYPRFGFECASKYGICCPFEAPDEAFMARWLPGAVPRRVEGGVRYDRAFEGV